MRKTKSLNFLFHVILSLLIILFSSKSLFPQTKNDSILIDSLIQVKHLNKNVILVKFGSDAVTAINTEKGIVVVDAGISPDLTSRYRKKIGQTFNSNNFIYLIDTHGHSDHTGGNSIFADATIIGHKNCLQEISGLKDTTKLKSGLLNTIRNYSKKLVTLTQNTPEWADNFCQATKYKFAYNDLIKGISIMPPNVVFEDTLNLNLGNVTFNLIYFGKAHSTSDIFIYSPELKILFSGDLFFRYGKPGFDNYTKLDSQKWIEVSNWLNKRLPNIETIVTGHGQILSKDNLISFINNINNALND